MLCKVCFKRPYQGLSVLSINTGPNSNMEMQQCTLSLLTIVQPWHFDWLTPRDNPVQFDVSSFVHAAVLQRLYEDGWIQAFAWDEVKRPWIWRRGEERGEEVRYRKQEQHMQLHHCTFFFSYFSSLPFNVSLHYIPIYILCFAVLHTSN